MDILPTLIAYCILMISMPAATGDIKQYCKRYFV